MERPVLRPAGKGFDHECSVLKKLPAACLLLEGALTVIWLTSLLSTLSVYSGLTLAVIAARGVVGALQLTSGWWLLAARLVAPALAIAAVVASALLTVVEVGLRLSPSNLDPTFRWPFVAVYLLYCALVIWLLTRGRAAK
jgi:hypothetical protein